MGAGRRDREHGLRHRRGGEGRPGHLGDRGARAAQRRSGQPAGRGPPARPTGSPGRPRCRRAAPPSAPCRARRPQAPPAARAPGPPGWPRPSPCSVPATAARGCGWSCRTSSSPTAPWSDRSPGRSRCAGWPPGTTCWSWRSSTRASWRCPTSARSCWWIPRPATAARCGPPSPGCASSTPASRPYHRAAVAQAVRASGAQHLVLRTDRDWVVDLARFVGSRGAAATAARLPGARDDLPVPLVAAAARAGGDAGGGLRGPAPPTQPLRRAVRLAADARAAGAPPARLAPARARGLDAVRVRAARPGGGPPGDGGAGAARERHGDRHDRRLTSMRATDVEPNRLDAAAEGGHPVRGGPARGLQRRHRHLLRPHHRPRHHRAPTG